MRTLLCLGLAATLLPLSGAARAQEQACTAAIENIGQTTYTVDRGGYDPFGAAAQSEVITIRIAPGGPAASCRLALAVRSLQGVEGALREARNSRGEALVYRLSVDPSGQIPLFSSRVLDSRSLAPVPLTGGASPNSDAELYFAPVQNDPARGAIRSGDYRQDVQFELYDVTGAAPRLLDTVATQIVIPVVSVSEIRVSNIPVDFEGAAARTVLDFGELEAGEELSAFLTLRSTSPYRLEFLSQNGWMMTSELGGMVGYAMFFDGTETATAANSQVVKAPSWMTSADSHELRFRIRDFEIQPAGDYRDVVRVRMVPTQ